MCRASPWGLQEKRRLAALDAEIDKQQAPAIMQCLRLAAQERRQLDSRVAALESCASAPVPLPLPPTRVVMRKTNYRTKPELDTRESGEGSPSLGREGKGRVGCCSSRRPTLSLRPRDKEIPTRQVSVDIPLLNGFSQYFHPRHRGRMRYL